uniref:Uncharacterized protein n=1 Tax=Onchocerca volvulus TaxID=6282 RepID=A0A8R1TWV9_ONCVO
MLGTSLFTIIPLPISLVDFILWLFMFITHLTNKLQNSLKCNKSTKMQQNCSKSSQNGYVIIEL